MGKMKYRYVVVPSSASGDRKLLVFHARPAYFFSDRHIITGKRILPSREPPSTNIIHGPRSSPSRYTR